MRAGALIVAAVVALVFLVALFIFIASPYCC